MVSVRYTVVYRNNINKKIKGEYMLTLKKTNIILEIIGLFMVIIGLLISNELIYISLIPFILAIFINLYTNGGCYD